MIHNQFNSIIRGMPFRVNIFYKQTLHPGKIFFNRNCSSLTPVVLHDVVINVMSMSVLGVWKMRRYFHKRGEAVQKQGLTVKMISHQGPTVK